MKERRRFGSFRWLASLLGRNARAAIVASTFAIAFLIAHGLVGAHWNWPAIEAVATTSAVIVALWLASQARRDAQETNRIKSAAIAGELAIELLETAYQVRGVVVAVTALDRIDPGKVDSKVAQAIREIRFDALESAARHADVLTIDVARWVGSLLGQLRSLKSEEAKFSQPNRKQPKPGVWTVRIANMVPDTAGKIVAIHKYAWDKSGLHGRPDLETLFEEARVRAYESISRYADSEKKD